MNNLTRLNLHLFDGEEEASSGETSVAAAQDTGVNTVAAEQTEETNTTPVEKTYTQKELDHILKGRLKGAKENETRLNDLRPLLDKIGSRYGKDPKDVKGIMDAIDNDNAYWEEAAANDGLTVEQKKHIAGLEWEKAQSDRAKAEAAKAESAQKFINEWKRQGDETKKAYPGFDFDTEMGNDKFTALLKADIDVKTAYEIVHKDEIIGGAMKYTAEKVREGITNSIQARASRPAENGSSSQATASIKIDPSKLTLKQMEDLEKRAARGERITMG